MVTCKKSEKRELTIRDLYPKLSDEQLQEAEENLEHYIELSLRIYERILSDPDVYKKFQVHLAERNESMTKHKARVKRKL
jgi:hypothetical protein